MTTVPEFIIRFFQLVVRITAGKTYITFKEKTTFGSATATFVRNRWRATWDHEVVGDPATLALRNQALIERFAQRFSGDRQSVSFTTKIDGHKLTVTLEFDEGYHMDYYKAHFAAQMLATPNLTDAMLIRALDGTIAANNRVA
jgi:hypothetical protein